MSPLTIAVPKGRILDELRPVFARAGINLGQLGVSTRKLMIDTDDGNHRLLLLRASDVPTYVAYGVADLGVAGGDTLVEEDSNLVEPLDLKIGVCRLVVAAPQGRTDDAFDPLVKVATKYPRIARSFFRSRGIDATIIKLYGSVELACISGLADVVVDLVSSGATLEANNLTEVETIMHVSSRLVVNRASLMTRCAEIDELVAAIRQAREEEYDS